MPDPLPFQRRREDLTKAEAAAAPLERAMALQADPSINVRVTKGERSRRFHIRPGRGVFEWYCQVWFNEIQHRGDTAKDVTQAHRLKAQYMREIDELLRDGWTSA